MQVVNIFYGNQTIQIEKIKLKKTKENKKQGNVNEKCLIIMAIITQKTNNNKRKPLFFQQIDVNLCVNLCFCNYLCSIKLWKSFQFVNNQFILHKI